MPVSALVLTAALAAATPAPVSHEVAVQHRDAAYQVSYRPHVRTEMKTVGMSAGTRPSTERCRWEMTVQVERQIRRQGDAASVDRLLPDTHVIRGDRPGNCTMGRGAIEAAHMAQIDRLQAHVTRVASADHPNVLADIDSARALASN
jgi:hypothetical protein